MSDDLLLPKIFRNQGFVVFVRSQVIPDFQTHYDIAILLGKRDAGRTLIVFEAYAERIFLCHVSGARTKTEFSKFALRFGRD